MSFRREKFIPKGGPDGGNGGKGGDVIIRADRQLTTLMDYRYKRKYFAQHGDHGQGSNRTGKSGEDVLLRVPAGTLIKDADTDRVVADLTTDGESVVVARGGKGGRGNTEFKSSTIQAPRTAEDGEPGIERTLQFELKLLADVGLVGFPNAGKSTLISRISAAKPKIADYPFTTLIPNLGIVRFAEDKSFVVADMPGLIEGAHTGKGLGIEFLRHIERTRVLVFLIPSNSDDPATDYKTLLKELTSYHKDMTKKPRIVAISKMDLVDEKEGRKLKKLKFEKSIATIPISSVSGVGLQDLIEKMWKILIKKNEK
ncbi:MAG TPA: GTPase ObgE [Bacteroidota bacterium]|nr:GTPase ObgE [Bacteroidota bacterium]